jgi:hypothetical protein
MQGQLIAARKAYVAQNLVELNRVVTEPEFRTARKTLMSLRGKPVSSWSQEERHMAERACGLWNFAAQLVLECEIPDSVVESMRGTVVSCHDGAAELLAQLRTTRSRHHWLHFSRLADRLRKLDDVPQS